MTAQRTMNLTRAIPEGSAEATGDILLVVQGPGRSADVKVKSRAKVRLTSNVIGNEKVAAPRPP